MTDIIIRKNSDGDICGFEMDGHAGFAEYGQDIVCAALSMLSINTINSIAELTDSALSVSSDENKGYMSLMIEGPVQDDAELLLKSYKLGIDAIYRQYGKKYLKTTIKEV
ncbi:MAG: ribosomal-processing cysteine protease Prp [Butyrivibrio sp.]|jgi:uncharacterized protein YsxB (DUF464 family)|nr:ribosomal-processing cysteine protease Prp [Butyrivibrio sp.]